MISDLSLAETIQIFGLEVTYTYHYALETQIIENSSIICKKYLPVLAIFCSRYLQILRIKRI